MSENLAWILGFVVGLLIVFAFAAITRLIAKKRNAKKCEYDERQVLARGAAYSTSFFTVIFYMIACGLLDKLEIRWADIYIQMFLGLFLSVAVFVSISIFKDAYFTTGFSKKTMIITVSAIIVLQIISLIMCIIEGDSLIENGMLSDLAINLGVVAAFAEILVAAIIKSIADKKAVEEE